MDKTESPPSSQNDTLVVVESPLYEGSGEHIKVPLPPSLPPRPIQLTSLQIVRDSFTNWSSTVTNNPGICVPTTVTGVQNIITDAASKKKRVRVAGFRQTWSDLYSADSHILISLIPLKVATGTSADVAADVDGPPTDFNQIELVPVGAQDDKNKRYARVGAGVTNEQFRIWAIKNGWTLPANVIVVE